MFINKCVFIRSLFTNINQHCKCIERLDGRTQWEVDARVLSDKSNEVSTKQFIWMAALVGIFLGIFAISNV